MSGKKRSTDSRDVFEKALDFLPAIGAASNAARAAKKLYPSPQKRLLHIKPGDRSAKLSPPFKPRPI